MSYVRKYIMLFLLTVVGFQAAATASDTVKHFTLTDFFSIILANHPVAKQAHLLVEGARQEIRIARGFLDPTIESKYHEKEFNDKHYYSIWQSYLKVPTWFGVDLQAGFERNTGPFTNNEKFTPSQGLSSVGLSVPIGQGMLIDERRAAILQAKQLPLIAEAERVKIINKILLQAAKDYWDWMYYYNKLNLHQDAYDMSMTRFRAVKEGVRYGDLPAIDTVEALLQAQNYEVMLRQSEMEYQNSRLILSTYLWNEETVPLEMEETLIPSTQGAEIEPLPENTIEEMIEAAKENHPDLVKSNAKLAQLGIERRLATNKLLPKVRFEYNLLRDGFSFEEEMIADPVFTNNYKYGISFSFPLLLRAERGKRRLTAIKIEQTDYEILQSRRNIENEIQKTANEWRGFASQLRSQESMVRSAEILLRGEQIKFENGESSLFLINTRENYLISNQVKLYELMVKYAKTKTALQWASGSMDLN